MQMIKVKKRYEIFLMKLTYGTIACVLKKKIHKRVFVLRTAIFVHQVHRIMGEIVNEIW